MSLHHVTSPGHRAFLSYLAWAVATCKERLWSRCDTLAVLALEGHLSASSCRRSQEPAAKERCRDCTAIRHQRGCGERAGLNASDVASCLCTQKESLAPVPSTYNPPPPFPQLRCDAVCSQR
eukprot:6182950-Pleurochrysis_carterae.AAC.1